MYADLLVDGGEDMLRQYYYKELCKYRVQYGNFNSIEEARQDFPYATLVEQYETAVLDLCRLMIAYTWARFTEPVAANDEDAGGGVAERRVRVSGCILVEDRIALRRVAAARV